MVFRICEKSFSKKYAIVLNYGSNKLFNSMKLLSDVDLLPKGFWYSFLNYHDVNIPYDMITRMDKGFNQTLFQRMDFHF